MNEEDLLAEIFAAPDDDGPRAVYADWLSERGDPRGEFITLQLRGIDLARQAELIAQHGRAFAGALEPFVYRKAPRIFERGFLASATLQPKLSEDQMWMAITRPEWSLVHTLDIRTARDRPLGVLAAAPWFRRLRAIRGIEERHRQVLFAHGPLPDVRAAMFDPGEATPVYGELFPQLEELSFRTDVQHVAAHLQQSFPATLERLTLIDSLFSFALLAAEAHRAQLAVRVLAIEAPPGSSWNDRLELHRDARGRFTRLHIWTDDAETVDSMLGRLHEVTALFAEVAKPAARVAIEELDAPTDRPQGSAVRWRDRLIEVGTGQPAFMALEVHTATDEAAVRAAVAGPPFWLVDPKPPFEVRVEPGVVTLRVPRVAHRYYFEPWLARFLEEIRVESLAIPFLERSPAEQLDGPILLPFRQPYVWMRALGPREAAFVSLDELATMWSGGLLRQRTDRHLIFFFGRYVEQTGPSDWMDTFELETVRALWRQFERTHGWLPAPLIDEILGPSTEPGSKAYEEMGQRRWGDVELLIHVSLDERTIALGLWRSGTRLAGPELLTTREAATAALQRFATALGR